MDRSLRNLILLSVVAIVAISAIQFIYSHNSKLRYKTVSSLETFAPPALAANQFALHPLFVQLTEIMPDVIWNGSKNDIQFALKGTSRSGTGTALKAERVTAIDQILLKAGWQESQEFLLGQATTVQHGYTKKEQGKEAIVTITRKYKSTNNRQVTNLEELACPCPYTITVFYAVSTPLSSYDRFTASVVEL